MKLSYPLLLAVILALTAACQDGSSSKGNDDDSSGVTDDCYPGCTCYDRNDGGALGCVDPEPRSSGDLTLGGVHGVRVRYESSYPGSSDQVLGFEISIGTCQFLLGTMVGLSVKPVSPSGLQYPVTFSLATTRSMSDKPTCAARQFDGSAELYSFFGGCGHVEIDRLDYSAETATATFIKGSFRNVNLCHAGTVQEMPQPSEQGLPQELHLGRFDFETDQLEATLDFHD